MLTPRLIFAAVAAATLAACATNAGTQNTPTSAKPTLTVANSAENTPSAHRIIAAHPVVLGLTQRLVQGTDISVFAAAPARLPASRQGAYLAGRGLDALHAEAARSQAVIGLRSVWSDDQLYALARRANIRLVEIDAARPVEGDVPGITLAQSVENASDKNRHILIAQPWQDAANLARMTTLIADGLSRLYPQQRATLQTNARTMAAQLQAAEAAASARLATSADIGVLLLSERVQTLAAALQLEVAAWQPPAKDAELPATLAAAVARHRPRAVLSHSTPDAAIVEQLKAAKIPLIILSENAPDPVAALSQALDQIAAAMQ